MKGSDSSSHRAGREIDSTLGLPSSQKTMWDSKFSKGEHSQYRFNPMPFAKKVEKITELKLKILDLGCGVGGDSFYFAKKGHKVDAVDFSDVVINHSKKHYKNLNLSFKVQDITKPYPQKNSSYNLVYSHLSIHYFTHDVTKKMITEVARILKPSGTFAFAAKSINDQHFGEGNEIEKNLFISKKGHVRHLFSKSYCEKLLRDKFSVVSIEEVVEDYSGQKSHILYVIARKR